MKKGAVLILASTLTSTKTAKWMERLRCEPDYYFFPFKKEKSSVFFNRNTVPSKLQKPVDIAEN
jgi:hypothetical protein